MLRKVSQRVFTHTIRRWVKILGAVVQQPRLRIQFPARIAKADINRGVALTSDLAKAVVDDVIQRRAAVINGTVLLKSEGLKSLGY